MHLLRSHNSKIALLKLSVIFKNYIKLPLANIQKEKKTYLAIQRCKKVNKIKNKNKLFSL